MHHSILGSHTTHTTYKNTPHTDHMQSTKHFWYYTIQITHHTRTHCKTPHRTHSSQHTTQIPPSSLIDFVATSTAPSLLGTYGARAYGQKLQHTVGDSCPTKSAAETQDPRSRIIPMGLEDFVPPVTQRVDPSGAHERRLGGGMGVCV